jgi:G protein-coupled receptor GPR1
LLNVPIDYSVLVIAIHSALQVFRPSATAAGDGLYPYRYHVYVGALLVPAFMAGMAFINPRWGYMSQGGFCTLPLRPFWYRLALAWIPRYIVAVIVLGLAVAIYTHVGFEFRTFSEIGQKVKPSISTVTPMPSDCDVEQGRAGSSEPSDAIEQRSQASPDRRASSVIHEVIPSQRRASAVAFALAREDSHHTPDGRGSRSQTSPNTPRNSLVPIHAVLQSDVPLYVSHSLDSTAERGSIPFNSRNHSPSTECPVSHVQRQLDQERARIHRQLRLLFIYPLTYILMWVAPFVSHCLTYQDKWAAHPIYWLTLTGLLCISLLGAVDCLIFSLRERPWRHIVGTDGTFWGSFVWWRRKGDPGSAGRTRGSIARLSRSFSDSTWHDNDGRSISTADNKTKTEMAMRAEHTEESSRASVSGARSMRKSSDTRRGDRGSARLRLECEREDRRVEKARREMGVQEGERWEEVKLGDEARGSGKEDQEEY